MSNKQVLVKPISKSRGFSLIELMIGITIVAILVGVALPNLNDFIVRMRVDNEITELQRLLLTARNTAINTGKNTTVCPLSGGACSGSNNWKGELGVLNEDGIVKVKAAILASDNLEFDYASLIYTPRGNLSTTDATGTFSYCPAGKTHLNPSPTLVISIFSP